MLRQLLTPSAIAFRSAPLVQFQMANFSFMVEQQRFFAKKAKKSGRTTASDAEAEDADAPSEAAATHHYQAPSAQSTGKIDWSREANKDSLEAPKLPAHFY